MQLEQLSHTPLKFRVLSQILLCLCLFSVELSCFHFSYHSGKCHFHLHQQFLSGTPIPLYIENHSMLFLQWGPITSFFGSMWQGCPGGEYYFGLDVRGLLQHSVPLCDILQVEPTFPGSEGSEINPIIVHGVTVQQFESFMTWLHHLWAWQTDYALLNSYVGLGPGSLLRIFQKKCS